MIKFHLLGYLTSRLRIKDPANWWLFKFFYLNFCTKEGAYKNIVRFFDTFGTFCGLAGLLIGIFSLLTDLDFVLEFESKGALKNLTIRLNNFEKRTKTVADKLKMIIEPLDWNVSCEDLDTALIGGAVAAFIINIIPGKVF